MYNLYGPYYMALFSVIHRFGRIVDSVPTNGLYERMVNFQVDGQIKDFSKMANGHSLDR